MSKPIKGKTASICPDERIDPQRRVSLLIHYRDGVKVAALTPNKTTVVGREIPSDIIVAEPSLSRQHAKFTLTGDTIAVEDLKSTNGTFINGERIEAGEAGPDDVIKLGVVSVSVHVLGAGESASQLLWGHDRFMPELASELERARTFGHPLGLLMVRSDDPATAVSRWALSIRELLQPFHRLALYSHQEVEIALPATGREDLLAVAGKIVQQPSLELRCGVGIYPESAASAEELITVGRAALQQTRRSTPVVIAPAKASPAPPVTQNELEAPGGAAMQEVFRTIGRVASATLPVLIYGETGAGKEVIAQRIHQRSNRRDGRMLCLNCAALPAELIESALFGHERGAFTGAEGRRKGLFEEADGGTVLLDEIGDLSAAGQAALLRVLETKTVTRIGSHVEIPVDVRVLAATNRNLDEMCEKGAFRTDLLYRLNAVTIHVPPLRERTEEIGPLAVHFMKEANAANGCSARGIDEEAMLLLRAYPWPGNVRELRNAIERAVVLARNRMITPADLPERVSSFEGDARLRRITEAEGLPMANDTSQYAAIDAELVDYNEDDPTQPFGGRPAWLDQSTAPGQGAAEQQPSLKQQVQRFETLLLVLALQQHDWVRAQAARALGMPLRTLFYKMRLYKLQRGNPSAEEACRAATATPRVADNELDFKSAVKRYEAKLIESALTQTGWNKSAAARLLQVTNKTLAAKMKSYRLEPPS